MNEELSKLRQLVQELEDLGSKRKELLMKKVISEAKLSDKEDEVRGTLLDSGIPTSRIPFQLKNNTQEERRELHKADSNFKVVNYEYELKIELINAHKFNLRYEMDLSRTTNL